MTNTTATIHKTNIYADVYCGVDIFKAEGITQNWDEVTCPDCDPTKPQG